MKQRRPDREASSPPHRHGTERGTARPHDLEDAPPRPPAERLEAQVVHHGLERELRAPDLGPRVADDLVELEAERRGGKVAQEGRVHWHDVLDRRVVCGAGANLQRADLQRSCASTQIRLGQLLCNVISCSTCPRTSDTMTLIHMTVGMRPASTCAQYVMCPTNKHVIIMQHGARLAGHATALLRRTGKMS
jgi:hypothetical protein